MFFLELSLRWLVVMLFLRTWLKLTSPKNRVNLLYVWQNLIGAAEQPLEHAVLASTFKTV